MSRGVKVLMLLIVMMGALGTSTAISQEKKTTTTVQFVLMRIHSYPEFRDIKHQLRQIDGVDGVELVSESTGLQTFDVNFLAAPEDFFDKALSVFGEKYTLKEKKLPGGALEINLGKR